MSSFIVFIVCKWKDLAEAFNKDKHALVSRKMTRPC